jgi:hypothetical protein
LTWALVGDAPKMRWKFAGLNLNNRHPRVGRLKHPAKLARTEEFLNKPLVAKSLCLNASYRPV